MAVDTTHEDYDAMSSRWARMRDFLEGEERIRSRKEVYLPQLTDQDEKEYRAFRERGEFLNATARTHAGMVGLVFIKDPKITIGPGLDTMLEDADIASTSLYHLAKSLVYEVMAMGRAGTLVDWSEVEERPYLTSYRTEDILNWKYSRHRGRNLLSMVSLRETHVVDGGDAPPEVGASADSNPGLFVEETEIKIRVLRLVLDGEGEPSYRVELWHQQEKPGATKKKREIEWVLGELFEPTKNGKYLSQIPFIFHSSSRMIREVQPPPLDDLASLNVTHYKLSADHYHGLHFTALPTAWVAGFGKDSDLRLGSSQAWVSEDVNARADYLEFSGSGLSAIREELGRLERSMIMMGARMLEQPKAQVETAEAIQLRCAGESALLTGIVGSVSETLTDALKWAFWWANGTATDVDKVTPEQALIELNTDFSVQRMSSQEMTALAGLWVQRAISRRTLFDNLKNGEIIAGDRTFEDEQALIDDERSKDEGGGKLGLEDDNTE